MTARVNVMGVLTLAKREIWRFLKVFNQTIFAPVVTTLLFLAVLKLAVGGEQRMVDGALPFDLFLAPGLIMMAVVQNAFANTSSSLVLFKIQGVIVDLLMPPLTGGEITLAMVAGGVCRGLAVGVAVTIAIWLFIPIGFEHPWIALFYLVMSSMMLALLGMVAGIWSQSFDQVSVITNYIITPLSFLSGTFYSIHHLPEIWRGLCHFNPFFYMIDGFRYAMTGYTDGTVATGMTVITLTNLVLWWAAQRMISRGYRLKS